MSRRPHGSRNRQIELDAEVRRLAAEFGVGNQQPPVSRSPIPRPSASRQATSGEGTQHADGKLLSIGRLVTSNNINLLTDALRVPLDRHNIRARRPGRLVLRFASQRDLANDGTTDSSIKLRNLRVNGGEDFRDFSSSDIHCDVGGVVAMNSLRTVPGRPNAFRLAVILEAKAHDDQLGLLSERSHVRGRQFNPATYDEAPPLLVAAVIMDTTPDKAATMLTEAQTALVSLPQLYADLSPLGTLPEVDPVSLYDGR